MSHIATFNIDDDVWYNEEYVKLKSGRGVSRLVNSLLKSHFNVKRAAVPDDSISIDDELQQLAARKALLLEKKIAKEKEAQASEKQWTFYGRD